MNKEIGITKENAFIDNKDYLRWKESEKLIHREVAWNTNLRGNGKFGELDVHHKDGNKFNNRLENLDVLSREDHQIEHGQIIDYNGKKYRKLAHMSKIVHSTDRAFLIAKEWIPKSQVIYRDECVYIPEWLYLKKGFS